MDLIDTLALISAGLVVLLVLIYRGALRREVLVDAPQRDVNLGLTDLFIGLMLLFLAIAALGQIFPAMGIPLTQPADGVPIDPWIEAKRALLGQVFTQLPVVVFLILRLRSQPDGIRRTGLVPREPFKEIGAGCLALLAAIPLTLGLMALTMWIGDLIGHPAPMVGHEMLKVIGESTARGPVAVLLFSAVVVAPLLEEIIFRGLVQTAILNTLGRANRWPAVLIAAAMFAVVHLGSVTWHGLPALLALGIILGWLYEKHGSLLPCILVHAGFNAVNAGWVLMFSTHGNT